MATKPKYNPRTNALARKKTRERFLRARKQGKIFTRQLIAVAKQIDTIIKGYAHDGEITDFISLNQMLDRYSQLLLPWAKQVAAQMIAEINQRDEKAWFEMGREIGRGLREEVSSSRMVPVMKELQEEQVRLITSLPTQAAERVNKYAIEAVTGGTRAKELAAQILETGNVTKSRAMLIARTEISRTQAFLNAARAENVGATSYIWHTSGDSDVREIHKELNGKVFRYDDPPVIGERGERGLPGSIFNCRCFAEPILPD